MDNLVIDDLIGVRFKNHGRSKDEGFDCYGLAIEVSKRLGHELVDLWYERADPDTFSENVDDVYAQMAEMVEETDEQKLGNLILFSDDMGRMVHIGVIIDEGLFIHADVSRVHITRLDGYFRTKWKVYKWRQ